MYLYVCGRVYRLFFARRIALECLADGQKQLALMHVLTCQLLCQRPGTTETTMGTMLSLTASCINHFQGKAASVKYLDGSTDGMYSVSKDLESKGLTPSQIGAYLKKVGTGGCDA